MTALAEIKPTLDEIKSKISQNDIKTDEEPQFYELKEPTNGRPDIDDFIAVVVSFYNSLGGYLIIRTGDMKKTKKWVQEHAWESTEQWNKNSLSKIKIGICCEYGENYVILNIDRAEHPFEFASCDKRIILRVGGRTKRIEFDEGDTVLLKSIMEQRLIANSHKEAAEFWEKFYEKCNTLFSNPALMDMSTPGIGHDPTFNECRSISINSQNIRGLHELHHISIQLNAPTDVKNALDKLISASDGVESRRKSKVCKLFTLAAQYNIELGGFQNLSLDKIGKTKEWLKYIKEGS
jgi:hypothetical protein